MIKEIVSSLNLPKNEILLLHVRLKGIIGGNSTYEEATRELLEELNSQYSPKTILIPTYTYSFTKTSIFDRVNTPSEVGRIGEEARKIFGPEYRTMNPIFSLVDVNKSFLKYTALSDESAFEKNSHFEFLAKEGYIMININLDKLYPAHFHFIEREYDVDYRFHKLIQGKLIDEEGKGREIVYDYYARRLDFNTIWRPKKTEDFLIEKNALTVCSTENTRLLWLHSKEMDRALADEMSVNKRFFITD